MKPSRRKTEAPKGTINPLTATLVDIDGVPTLRLDIPLQNAEETSTGKGDLVFNSRRFVNLDGVEINGNTPYAKILIGVNKEKEPEKTGEETPEPVALEGVADPMHY